jgi:hypothetical protein
VANWYCWHDAAYIIAQYGLPYYTDGNGDPVRWTTLIRILFVLSNLLQIPPSLNACHLSALSGPLIAGFAVYLILSYLFVPNRIATPLAIIISTLIFGLSWYYTDTKNNNNEKRSEIVTSNEVLGQYLQRQETDKMLNNNDYTLSVFANLFFVVGYAICLIIVTPHFLVLNPSSEKIFVPWEQVTIVQIIKLGASIALCFFLPGYALLSVLYTEPGHQIKPILKILLAYLLSILVTGLTGYVAASVGFDLSDIRGLFVVVYLSILFILLVRLSLRVRNQKNRTKYLMRNLSLIRTSEIVKHQVRNFLKRNSAEFIVFASLFALVILTTYSLYSGAIIGDQWYHHGRSLAFLSGDFRDIALAGADNKIFSPFPSALLASFFSVSGIASVNAYASISFLNIIPVLAFYYFFRNWVPNRMKKAALLACTLFMLSSGFGWIYVLNLAVTDPPESQESALQMMHQAGIKLLDIILPTSFVGGAHPDFSTPLIIMALPAGFVMLGILREKEVKNKFNSKYFALILPITFLGIISHDEFYLFIITASIIPIFLFFSTSSDYKNKKNFVAVYVALLAALLLTLVLATFLFAGAGYFTYVTILGVSLVVLCLVFVAVMSILYTTITFSHRIFSQRRYSSSHIHLKRSFLRQPWIRFLRDRRHRTTVPSVALVCIFAWLYVVTFVVWGELSVEAVEVQTNDYTIPWYLYPMKLGITGLLGFAFVLSYLFRKFEKEIFVFAIIVVIAFVTGPYYDEHRFSKYMMAGLAGLGSLFVYNLIITSPKVQKNNQFRILANSLVLGTVILSSALSVLMFWGYNASAYDSGFEKELGRRDFPSASEFNLFRLLHTENKNPLAFNVVAPANEYGTHTGDLFGKVHAFSGIPWIKGLQSPLTLNASTLEGFYDLLYRSDARYIVLPKDDFINLTTGTDTEVETVGKAKQKIEENRKEHREGNVRRGPQEATLIENQRSTATANILHFAIENFQKAYEDGKYLVLAVPSLTPQRSHADIGLLIPKSSLFTPSALSDTNGMVLQYDNHTFAEEEIGNLARSGKLEISTAGSILHGDKGEMTTLWFNPLWQQQFQNANYFEVVFRILGQNKTSNDAGIIWSYGDKEYMASVRNDRLEILEKPIDAESPKDTSERKLINVRDIKRENSVWYSLKVITLEDYIDVYINDLLAVKIPKESKQSHSRPYQQVASTDTSTENRTSSYSYPAISKVGLYSFNNIAEFRPIEIGQVPPQLFEKDTAYFEHYYPLNMLSLSKSNYETFMEGDLSVFSKKIIVADMASLKHLYSSITNSTDSILSPDYKAGSSLHTDKTIDYHDNFADNKFLDFVKRGGTLIITNIINPNNTYYPSQDIFQDTKLGELLSVQAEGDEIEFDKIEQIAADISNKTKKPEASQIQYLNVSGVVQDIKIKNGSLLSPDFKVISSYMRDNNEVAPFALEKKYGAGKIILINSGGYFRTIVSSPGQYFQTLAEIPSLIDLDTVLRHNNKLVSDNTLTPNVTSIAQVVGDLKVSGHSLINSSSLSLFTNETSDSVYSFDNDQFHVQSILFPSTSNGGGRSDKQSDILDTKYILQSKNHRLSNATIRDLRVEGEYEAIIASNNSLVWPTMLASHYDYIATSIPAGFNLIIKLHEGATAEFIAENGRHGQPVRLAGETEIRFYNISDIQNKKELSILLKSPEIRVVNGSANFEKLFMFDPHSKIAIDGRPLDVKGDMIARFDHVDSYDEIDSKGGWINTQYVTYLKSIHFDKNNVYDNEKKINLEFPADISALAKKTGVLVPWQKALLSSTNMLISLSIIVVAVTLKILWRPRRLVLK